MPIRGLTDREEGAFPQIGVIRKGAPKQQNAPGKDLPYFRVEFDDKEIEAAQDFVHRFSNAPTDITIMLPFNEIDRCWEAWRETYVAGAMVHRCDGEYVRYAINAKTGEKLVLNGLSLADGRPVACKGNPDGCKPVGRLRVIIPELQRLAYLVVMTTSIHDIINISNQLKAIAQMTNGRIAGIPLVLRRRPKKISTPSGEGGKRARREKWLISIEADPEWVRAQLAKMHHDALPGNGLNDAKQIESPVAQFHPNVGPEWTSDFDDDDDEGEEPETVEGEYSAQNGGNGKAEHPAPVPDENAKPARLKYQPFVGWCNTWIVDHRASKYGKEVEAGEIPQANMFHILARVGKLGYPEINADNVDAVKRDLQKYIEKEA